MKTASIVLIGIFFLTGCASSNSLIVPTVTEPAATQVKILPAPGVPGDRVVWQDLHITMVSAEITDSFITDFGTRRNPSAGQKFLWVQVRLENAGENELDLPDTEHFSALYADSEFKPTYGHRQGYPDYTALTTPLFPGETIDAWLRFDIPDQAELRTAWFVFMPESAQIGVRPVSPDYPWGGEHPVFVWECQ